MTEEKFIKLDRYFQKEMAGTEIPGFLKELETDAELKAAFDLREYTAAALHRADMLAFKNKYHQQKQKPIAILKPIWKRPLMLAIAASFTLLFGFMLWWTMAPNSQAQELFALYDIPELYPETKYALVNDGLWHKGIIGSNDFSELKIKGLVAYKSQNWDEAIKYLNSYLEEAKPSDEETPDEINLVNMYVGRAWLEKGENGKAIASLKRADEGVTDLANYGLLKELIQWQLTLAYLKNNDPTAAKRTAEPLQSAEQETIRQQAINLLNDLK